MTSFSTRSQKIKSFIAMEVLERANGMISQGEDVISLSIGEPDFPPPNCVKKACIEALDEDFTKYTHSQGLLELREAIAEHYHKKYSLDIHPDRILITAGSSPAFLLILSVLLNPKDEVILPDLHYPCYPNFINFLEGKIKYVKVHAKDKFQYDPELVKKEITSKTKAIFVSSPSNPTGYLIPGNTLQKLSELGPYIISDEVYHGLVYEGAEESALKYTDKTFIVNGFSKAYSMTGFRLGYLIAPKEFIRPIQILHQNFYISVNSFSQKAGIAALRQGSHDQEKMKEVFIERRKVALEELAKIGLKPIHPPEGAFYIFVSVKNYTSDSYHFAFDCLEKAKVGITPGVDFGPGGEGYIRISYANSIENIKEGIRRLGKYLESLSSASY